MNESHDVVDLYLDVAGIVVDTLASTEVRDAWNSPSVLKAQTVGSLAGHLARGGVWLVGQYLDDGVPSGPVSIDSAAEYFATFAADATPAAEKAIRDRGAEAAATGHARVVEDAGQRLASLDPLLRATPVDQRITVIGGQVMHLGNYLDTRLVEQVVHLDDLARSLGRDSFPLPTRATARVLTIGFEVAQIRAGDTAVLRALYRDGFAADTFPIF